MKNLFAIFTERRIVVTLLLGFSSGLPLALSASTLQAWFAKSDVSLKEIGFVGLASLPYTLKFLWAPFMDRWVPPFLGRRRGWIFFCQAILCVIMASMVFFTPDTNPKALFILACLLAFFSASQDIVVDTYRTDVLHADERPMGAAMAINGYRIAMLVSGGVALVIADIWGWKAAYLSMAGLMATGMLATLLGQNRIEVEVPPKRLWDCTILPLLDFLKRPQALWILLFIVFYKLGDAFAGAMSQTFLIREIQMTLSEIGVMAKFSGFFGTILGTTFGAVLVIKLGWFRSLLCFGILQAASNLIYLVLMWTGPNYLVAGSAIFVENFCGGMGAAAFTGLIMDLCNSRFSAFQYALLSSLSAVGRVIVGPMAGIIAADYGWNAYFFASVVLSIPGLWLLFIIKNRLAIFSSHLSVEIEKTFTPVATTATR
jgi:PAT family beta-lactamase induction signal transducer AmpG